MDNDPLTTPELKQPARKVWVRQAVDNISWFTLGDKAAIVDTGEKQPGLADDVLQELRETVADNPPQYILNTHTHYDHTGLNDMLKKQYDVEVINGSDERVRQDEGLVLRGPRRSVRMFFAGGVHTDIDCCIHLPDDGVLFVGDLFGWGLIPANNQLTPEMADRLVKIYNELIALDADVVVPGHGPNGSTEELRRWLRYFRWLSETAVRGVQDGLGDAQIAAQLPPPDDMKDWWRFLDWKHANSVEKTIALARTGWEGLKS